ncbi:hypothetical protein AB0K67_10675 [Nonomuraea sp. NPDC052634]|uniref:hypothetical protein n=1 Tax=Nonomuraea sp. NPDC052634 TaxID=3155813 RepID=UPI0034488B2E
MTARHGTGPRRSDAPGERPVPPLARLAGPGGKLVEIVSGAGVAGDPPVGGAPVGGAPVGGAPVGGAEVRLGRDGAAEPHLRVPLHVLFTASTGRPWRFRPADPASVRVLPPGSGGDGIVATARAGELSVRLELGFGREGMLELRTTWRNDTGERLVDVAAGLLLPLPVQDACLTMPGVLYNDNPSSDPAREVPHIGFVCEEHRLPIPAVNAAWDGRYLSLFAHPGPVRDEEDGSVAYGSLGAVRAPGLAVTAMTGVIAFNGRPDVCYVSKAETAGRPLGYRDLAPGAEITTRHSLDWGEVAPRGFGFRTLVHTRLYRDEGAAPLSVDEIVRLKTDAMDSRWNGDGHLAYEGVRHGRPRSYLYGWTGQAMKLALCEAILGVEDGQDERIERARRAADFYVHGGRTPVRGLHAARYLVDEDRWESFRKDGWGDFVSSRAHGETITDLAALALLFRQAGLEVPHAWEEAVTDAASVFWHTRLPEGVVPVGWSPWGTPVSGMVSAAGVACVLAMLGAYRLSGERVWLLRAEEVLAAYHREHAATYERPFAHATLDASGEDKEAGMYFFLAAYELHRLTGDERYAGWAEAAADWLLTFVYVWSPEFAAGSTFARRGFKAAGWPAVSVQNHHLDVFFPTSELLEFGLSTGRPRYAERAVRILHAMGQGICREPGDWGFRTPGEQGEGFFQTNWQRTGEANTWNPSWVIALPLYHALRMRKVRWTG